MAKEARSRFQIFREDVLRIRVKGKPSERDHAPNTAGTGNDLVDIVNGMQNTDSAGNVSDLQMFRQMSSDAETRYRIFDEMETDSVITSALDMYADDATQYNNKGEVIWAESDNADVAAFANRLIDMFNLNANAWDHIRSLIKYGDLYLELFRDDETGDDMYPYETDPVSGASTVVMYRPKKGSKLQEYIEKVDNPARIYEFTRKGKTNGFIKTKENDTDPLEHKYNYQSIMISEEDVILPSDKYIHVYMPDNGRFPQTVDIEMNKDGKSKIITYKVRYGKSILHDLYKVYKELKLMEDALLLNRVTRSSIIRMLQIEMGDMPKAQARETLKRFKMLIEQKNFMDKEQGNYKSQASPGPIDNCIYIPTYNGKGAVSAANLGGDVDVKTIVDLEYFREKLAGGLKIPLSYISGTSQENGLGGGASLTKIDARYARTIKRVQNAYIQGITNLINMFAHDKGLTDHVNNFTIKMVSPSTMEDAERDEALATKIDLTNSILDILANIEEIDPEIKKEIVIYLINTYLNEPDISDILNKKPEPKDEEVPEEGSDEEGGGFSGGGGSSIGGSDFGGDTGGDFGSGGEEGGDDFGSSDFGSEDGGDFGADDTGSDDTAGDEGFGDFEDEYEEEF